MDEIKNIVANTSFTMKEFVGRLDSDNRESFAIASGSFDPVALNAIEKSSDKKIKGIYTLYGTIDARDITQINTNENIFLIDLIANELKNTMQFNKPVEFEVHNPFWYIETK